MREGVSVKERESGGRECERERVWERASGEERAYGSERESVGERECGRESV